MSVPPKHLSAVFELFARVKDAREAEMLLRDILTPQELESVAERWQLIQELAKGTPQRGIAEKLGLSISKITRGSRQLKYGTGGFQKFIDRMGGKKGRGKG